MKSSIFLFLSLIILSSCVEEEEFPIENNITVLTENTFDKALEKYEHILVMFYGPLCSHCKTFGPELERAAAVLRKENLIVAKVDATAETKLAQKYKVRRYPTIKFFKRGQVSDYTAARKEQAVINWVRKKSEPPIKSLKTADDVEKFISENEACAIYFGNDVEEIEVFEGVALKMEDYPFGIVEDKIIANKFNAKQKSVVIFKKFDEKRNDLEIVKEKELIDFLEIYFHKKIGTFDDKTTERVFGKKRPALLYFGEKGDKWNEDEKIMENIADKVRSKFIIVMSEIKVGMQKRIAEFIGVKNENLPSVIILDTRKGVEKYIMEGNIDEKNILNFIDEWEQGKLKLHLKSQEEPKDNSGDIFVVV